MTNLENLKSYLPTGWENIADMLYVPLKDFVNAGGKVLQVKEKFGQLRVYMRGDSQPDLSEIENRAYDTCMICGAAATRIIVHGWVGPRCDAHAKPYYGHDN